MLCSLACRKRPKRDFPGAAPYCAIAVLFIDCNASHLKALSII